MHCSRISSFWKLCLFVTEENEWNNQSLLVRLAETVKMTISVVSVCDWGNCLSGTENVAVFLDKRKEIMTFNSSCKV